MELSTEQKQEITFFLIDGPKYRETYNEVYDHVINAFQDNEEFYSLDQVAKIINQDFGGFEQIRTEEVLYQKELNKKYMVDFRQEMLNTFKWPGILNNLTILGLCSALYFGNNKESFNMKPILVAMAIIFIGITLFVHIKVYINKTKRKHNSILDNPLCSVSILGVTMYNFIFFSFINDDGLIETSYSTKLILLLCMFFFSSLYVRSFIKFYNKKIKVLLV